MSSETTPAGEALSPTVPGLYDVVPAVPDFPRLDRERLTMGQSVADVLRWSITDGSLAPGTKLMAERIARDMGLSRGPVREALRELEKEGLVGVENYRSAVVLTISKDELINVLIPTRWILEKHAFENLVPALTDDNVAEIRDITAAMRRVAVQDSVRTRRELVELDIAYHRYVIDHSELRQTRQLWRVIQPRIQAGFYRLGLQHHQLIDIAREHEELLDALASRSVPVALAKLDDHVRVSPLELLEREFDG